MRARRTLTGIATAGLVAGVGLIGAAPAQAQSDACALFDGVGPGRGGGWGTWDPFIAFAAGETLTVTWTDLDVPDTAVTLSVPVETEVDSRIGAGSVSYTFLTDGATTFMSTLGSGEGTFTVSCGVVPAGSTSETAIPAWVQAHGRDKDATCLDGWDASWQAWAEPVTGGWVCTRSIPSLG